jgi:hypothetical protein
MKLTEEQKNLIKTKLLSTVKNADIRSMIISIANGYANETGEDGDLESMVLFLMDEQNSSKIDELFEQYGMSMPYTAE